MIEYEELKADIDCYLMERFKYRKLLVCPTEDNVFTIQRNSRVDLYLLIRRLKQISNCLTDYRSKEQTRDETHFLQFLTEVVRKYDFNHIGIECANDKSCAFAKKLGFYSIDSKNTQ